MNAIRIDAHIDSETLHVPELKPMIGKDVEIIFLEKQKKRTKQPKKKSVQKTGWFTRNFGAGWPDKKDDGFEEALGKWRRDDRLRELPE